MLSIKDRALIDPYWVGTAEGLVTEVDRVLTRLGLSCERPPLRTIRLWRTKGLLSSSAGRGFQSRQVAEAVAVVLLRLRGWSLAAIGDLVPLLDETDLLARIAQGTGANWGSQPDSTAVVPGVPNDPRTTSRRDLAVILLAQGILRLYERVLTGREIVRQNDELPAELHQAMCYLGRLYIEEGLPDRAACIHDVLDRARLPLDTGWGLEAFTSENFQFRNVVLIDPELRVPTPDAVAIAASGGRGLDDVIEHQLHRRLREVTERLGPMSDAAYTAVREMVGRRSLSTSLEITQWFEDHGIGAIRSIVEDLYDPVHEAWLMGGRANRCAHCASLLRPHPDRGRYPDGKCPLQACTAKQEPYASGRLEPVDLLVCRPQVLMYWCGPAVDELSIFDAARRDGLDAELYPNGDLCDIAVRGGRVGIDVKRYTSPVSLAMKLNRSIGGLISYQRRIVAVPDDLACRPGYLDVLRSGLEPQGDAASLELTSVTALLRQFKTGGFHA